MEEIFEFNNEECLNELKRIIEEYLKEVPFKQGFKYDVDIGYSDNRITGYLVVEGERKKIFIVEMEKNEIKYFYVIDSLQGHGIGSAILRFIINVFKKSEFEYVFAIPGGSKLFSDWLCEYIIDNNDENDQSKRKRFYKRIGFEECCKNDQLCLYFNLNKI